MRQASRERRSVTELAQRLRDRHEEIEAAMLTRVLAVSELPIAGSAEYAQGLRRAVTASLDYGFANLERGEAARPSPPPVLLGQAALAARSGVGLDTVLRRYLAGHAILSDFLVEESDGQLPPAELKRLLRRLAGAVDLLLVAVSDAYGKQLEGQHDGAERRRAELVERLLAGEPVDATDLIYELDGWHLGLVASGPAANASATALAHSLGARLLTVARESELLWAWIGSREPPDPGEVQRSANEAWTHGVVLAIGEPCEGPSGWRLTHRQASAGLAVAKHRGEPIVSYRDVGLVAAALQDDLLATSLRHLYLEPLERERDGGMALVETLRAYFAAERNVSSAAAALGLTRKTVNRRIRAVEQYVGRPLRDCDGELRLALQVSRWEPADSGPTNNGH